jgi:hypothetical protein
MNCYPGYCKHSVDVRGPNFDTEAHDVLSILEDRQISRLVEKTFVYVYSALTSGGYGKTIIGSSPRPLMGLYSPIMICV